jgi:hypothetical protein
MPEVSTGKVRQEDCATPSPTQESFEWIDVQASLDQIAETYEVMRKAVTVFGGRGKLALHLGEAIDYEAHISNGLNRRHGKHAFVDYLVPLLSHPEAGSLLIEWMCVVAGYEKPKRRAIAREAELLRALVEELGESGSMGEHAIERAAKRIGTDKGAFRR